MFISWIDQLLHLILVYEPLIVHGGKLRGTLNRFCAGVTATRLELTLLTKVIFTYQGQRITSFWDDNAQIWK